MREICRAARVGLFFGGIEVEEGFVEVVVLFTPANVVFYAVLLLPRASIEVALHVNKLLLQVIVTDVWC